MGRLSGRHYQDVQIGATVFVIRPISLEETMLEAGATPGFVNAIAEQGAANLEMNEDTLGKMTVGLHLRKHAILSGVIGVRLTDGALERVRLVDGAPKSDLEDDYNELTEVERGALWDAISRASGIAPQAVAERFPGQQVAGEPALPV